VRLPWRYGWLPQSSGDTIRWLAVSVVKAETNVISLLHDVKAWTGIRIRMYLKASCYV